MGMHERNTQAKYNEGAQAQCTSTQIHNARLHTSVKHACAKEQSARTSTIQMRDDEVNQIYEILESAHLSSPSREAEGDNVVERSGAIFEIKI